METAVDNALGKLFGVGTAIPDTGIIENLFDSVFFNEHLVFVKTFLNGHFGKSQIRSVVAAEGAFTEHAVADNAGGVGAGSLEKVAIFVGVVSPLDEVAIDNWGVVEGFDLAESAGVADFPFINTNSEAFDFAGSPPVFMFGDKGN